MDFSAAFIKLLFIFNFILLCLGGFVIYKAYTSNNLTYDGQKMEDLDKVLSALNYKTFIIAGVVICVISFFGCFGAFFESPSCLSWYIFLIFLLILFQVAVGAYTHFTNLIPKDEVKGIFGGALKGYQSRIEYRSFVDKSQKWLHCCGAQGPDDWIAMGMKNPPKSCCQDEKDPCEMEKSYKKNCVDACYEFIQDVQKNFIWYAGIVIGFQVVLIVLTFYARSNIKERQNYML